MLTKLPYAITGEQLQQAGKQHNYEFKSTINEPVGRFFYDPWQIKSEYKNTVWDKILSTLPFAIGEARVIVLKPTAAYQIHADIDDRYHLNIEGESCYLIDFDNDKLHKIEKDMQWYLMDAGRLHSAVNFGRVDRIQLVVRKLLNDTSLTNFVNIKMHSKKLSDDDARFVFDNTISPWLNRANKNNIIADFKFSHNLITFKLDADSVDGLRNSLPDNLYMEVL